MDHTLLVVIALVSFAALCRLSIVLSVEDHSESTFLYQPCNISIYEGEGTKFNCTPAQAMSELIATWIINGRRHYWTDFLLIPTYSFDLWDNSLTVHNASRNLDGSTYQCVINRLTSRVAYLTILYYSLNTSTSISQLTTVTAEVHVPTTQTISSTVTVDSATSTLTEPGTDFNTTRNSLIIGNTIINKRAPYEAVSAGITSSIIATLVLLTVIISSLVVFKFHMQQRSSKASETFTMDRNELYGQLNRKHTLVPLTRNELYGSRPFPQFKVAVHSVSELL